MEKIVEKYSTNAPRYTSYPPLPFWNGAPEENLWFTHLNSKLGDSKGIDLYIHIPFCEQLCRYCGCQRTITRDRDKGTEIVEYVLKEWSIYKSKLSDLKINSLHFGGGTPTFLRPVDLELLLKEFKPLFSEDFIGAMEIDPRTCHDEHLDLLEKYGFNKVSLGIQDFDERVQKAITREQSFEMVKELVDKIRERNIDDINFDLIYGLPLQTLNTVNDTIAKVVELNPSTVSFYSYAHVPWKIKNQKLIKEEDLPEGFDKFNLFLSAREKFAEADYIEVGFDHFAKKGSLLANAKSGGFLTRNFMGYTHQKSNVLLGLGPSSISYSGISYSQNDKDTNAYFKSLDDGHISQINGHIQSDADLKNEDAIISFMCHEYLKMNTTDLNKFSGFIEDGLATYEDGLYKVTDKGRPFMRNVAMIIDPYMTKAVKNFSKTI